MSDVPEGWETRGKPPTLFRRFTFGNYTDTRTFLDALAELSEETGIHPQNINFGTTYVNITLEAEDRKELTETEHALATRINELVTEQGG
jgi:pterin-4a-carbinolamine dehydratase